MRRQFYLNISHLLNSSMVPGNIDFMYDAGHLINRSLKFNCLTQLSSIDFFLSSYPCSHFLISHIMWHIIDAMRYRIVYTYSDRLAQFLIAHRAAHLSCTPDVTIVMEAWTACLEIRQYRHQMTHSPLQNSSYRTLWDHIHRTKCSHELPKWVWLDWF